MRWLLENFWLKVVAFVLGFLLWVYVITEKTFTYNVRLPLVEVILADGLTLAKAPPDSLFVTVAASGKQLLKRTWRSDGIKLNAAGYQAGRYTLPLNTTTTSLADGANDVELQDIISPSQVALEIDREGTTEVVVRPAIDAQPDDGFAIGRDTVILPDQVMLTGPRASLGNITEVYTAPLELHDLRNDVTVTLPLEHPSGYGYLLTPDSVTISLNVIPVKTRVFAKCPVVVFNVPPGFVVTTEPQTIDVELNGSPEEIVELSERAVTVSVDFRERSVENKVAPRIDFPPGYRVRGLSADSITIEVVENAVSRN